MLFRSEEAERLCDRVGIVDHGQLIAEGTRRELVGMVGELDSVALAATGDLAGAAKVLATMACVKKASVTDDSIDLVVAQARENLPGLLEKAAGSGAAVRSVTVTEPDLEAVFLHLTGRALRD